MSAFKTVTRTLRKDGDSRPHVLAGLINTLQELPEDRNLNVTIKEGMEARRSVQNRLYQSAIGQVRKQTGIDLSVIAGKCKKEILLPLKFVSAATLKDNDLKEQAEFERDLCELCAKRYDGDNLFVSYDRAVRSRNLRVRLFAEYVDDFLIYWQGQGVNFILSAEDEQRALGGSAGYRDAD